MRISPINNAYTFNKPAFRSMSCDYKLPNNKEMGLFTWMFRDCVDWRKLAILEDVNFTKQDKVNIVQFAPSDGSEGYTQILSLLRYAPKHADKFFPIQAYDINNSVVNGANLGYLNLNVGDVERILNNRINPDQYFTGALDYYIENRENKKVMSKTFKVSEELTKRIQFNTGDMFEILPKIQDNSNTVILARNSIGYYDSKIRYNFLAQAAEVLKKGSLFVVGDLEEMLGIKETMRQLGFKQLLRNVYRKVR